MLIEQYRKNELLKKSKGGKPKRGLYEYMYAVYNASLDDTSEDSNHSNDSLEMQHWEDSGVTGSEEFVEPVMPSDWSKDGCGESDWLKEGSGGPPTKGLKRQASDDYKANTP